LKWGIGKFSVKNGIKNAYIKAVFAENVAVEKLLGVIAFSSMPSDASTVKSTFSNFSKP
jgi:Na+-transporting NADH:ubiquinone oxidoreductase subunit NqrE